MVDDQTFHPSCETVSEATSQTRTDLSSSTDVSLLIATLSNLVIDEGSYLEEGIANESAANERTINEGSDTWKSAEETAPRGDSGDPAMKVSGRVRGYPIWTRRGDYLDSHPSLLSSGNESSCSCFAYVNLSGNLDSMRCLKKNHMKARKGKVNLGMAIKYKRNWQQALKSIMKTKKHWCITVLGVGEFEGLS